MGFFGAPWRRARTPDLPRHLRNFRCCPCLFNPHNRDVPPPSRSDEPAHRRQHLEGLAERQSLDLATKSNLAVRGKADDVEDDLTNVDADRLERFRAKWTPVRVKKTRQIKNLELRFDSIETEKALVADIRPIHEHAVTGRGCSGCTYGRSSHDRSTSRSARNAGHAHRRPGPANPGLCAAYGQ